MIPAVVFNGYELYHPGSYTKYDISKLNQGSPASRALVYIGEAEAGIPYSATDFSADERINVIGSTNQAKNVLRSGKLYDCTRFALTPSKDGAINPPAYVISIVVNALTRAEKILKEGLVDKISVKSYMYGKLANNTRIAILAGTTKGKMLKIAYNNEYELISDNVYRETFNIQYVGSGTAALMTITNTAITVTVDSILYKTYTLADYSSLGSLINEIDSDANLTATMLQDSEWDHNYIDNVTAVDIKTAIYTVNENMKAIVDWFNKTGNAVAAFTTAATRTTVDNTSGYVFLTGATAPSATPTDWSNALDLAKRIKCAFIGVATGSTSVHAQLISHINYMNSTIGRDERISCVGGLLTNTDGEMKLAAKNSANQAIGYWATPIWRYNDKGELKEYDPFYGAAEIMGMSAGNDVLFSPTFKNINTEKLTKSYTKEEMDDFIKNSCMIAEVSPLGGFRVVRAVTTFAGNNKIGNGWQETATSFHITKSHRSELEAFVGRVGVTLENITTYAGSVLDDYAGPEKQWLQIDPAYKNAWRGLTVTVDADVFKIEYEGTVPSTTNFVLTTHHFTVVGAK